MTEIVKPSQGEESRAWLVDKLSAVVKDCDGTHKPWIAIDQAADAILARFEQSLTLDRETVRREVINTPETADFMAGVPIEAAHQRERWGVDHDAGKAPFDWFWLIGYLAQKAADAAVRGDADKAKHHTISTAAALANWHAALSGTDTRFQPGITPKPAEMVV